MRRLMAVAVLALVLPAGAAVAQTAAPAAAPAAVAHSKRDLIVLDAKAFDPAMVLPQPPQEGSLAQGYELDVLRQIQKTRTAERLAQARWDEDHEDIEIFSAAIGPGFNLKALPAVARALETVRNDQATIGAVAKDYFRRPRPFVVDPSIGDCDHATTKPLTSYPSGHATLGYSLAYVLEALIPEKAQAIRARADDYAFSRLVCGAHYRSDVEASRVLGDWVGRAMLESPAFRPQLDAASTELKTAGLTR